jgi:hypothetical protein
LSLVSDERLLDTRICDLPIRIKGSFIEPHIKRLYSELNDRGIRFKPHVWLSAEWFTPDGVPGFAIPFYLAHPRLMNSGEANAQSRRTMLNACPDPPSAGRDRQCVSTSFQTPLASRVWIVYATYPSPTAPNQQPPLRAEPRAGTRKRIRLDFASLRRLAAARSLAAPLS